MGNILFRMCPDFKIDTSYFGRTAAERRTAKDGRRAVTIARATRCGDRIGKDVRPWSHIAGSVCQSVKSKQRIEATINKFFTFIYRNPNVMVAGPPPPPPPPPPVSGQLPAMRINTAEHTAAKRPQVGSNDAYEPPAAIQNAMLTKDKKPFTYTPGMGGKLDLSQIRSPRMARRVAKNANDEGIEGPPKSTVETKSSPAVSPAANFLMPQVAVPVFPSNAVPPQPNVNRMSQPPSINRTLSNATDKQTDKQAEPARNITVDTKVTPITVTSSQSNTPESPGTPTQVTLAKAPTPWLQNKNKTPERLPEWAIRTNVNKTADGDSSEKAPSPVYIQVQQSSPQCSQAKQKPQDQKPQSIPQYQPQQAKPQQLSQRCQQPQQQRQRPIESVPQQISSPLHQQERVIPIRIEDRPSVFDVKHESGHHQFKQQPTLHHQQRWGQVPAQQMRQNQMQNHPQAQEQSQIHVTSSPRLEQPAGTTYIVPIVVEGSDKRTITSNTQNNIQPGKTARVQQVQEPKKYMGSAIPSRSFKILQAMTASENTAMQENRQADYNCRTENNLPGNQQDVHFLPRLVSYWSNSEDWWNYYPMQHIPPSDKFANETDKHSSPYLQHPDKNPYIGHESFYPVNDGSFVNVIKAVDQEKSPEYGYIAVICPQANCNDLSHVNANDYNYDYDTTNHSSPAQNNTRFVQDESVDKPKNILSDVNHLDAQSNETYNPRNICENYNSDKNCIITAMNIVDEESNASDDPNKIIISDNENSKKTIGLLNINLLNYTYIDTSDSSDSSDYSDSDGSSDSGDSEIADNENLSDSCEKHRNANSDTLSNSDSDLHESNSMDFNSCEKLKRNPRAVFPAENSTNPVMPLECSINTENLQNNFECNSEKIDFTKSHMNYSNDSCTTLKQVEEHNNETYIDLHQSNLNLSDKMNSDKMSSGDNRESNMEQRNQESPITDNIIPHQLNIIDENAERFNSESLYYENKRDINGQSETAFEVADDPSDNAEAIMVSVSLPLKFKFFVSENNEDVTTVTVGDSKILKAEKSFTTKNDKDDLYRINNFHIDNDTRVDFTVKRPVSDAMRATASKKNKGNEAATLHTDFTFKKNLTSIKEAGCKERDTETEFPVTKTEINSAESALKNVNDSIDSESITDRRDILSLNDENCVGEKREESTCNDSEHVDDDSKTISESKLIASECFGMQDDFETFQTEITKASQTNQENCRVVANNENERRADSEVCRTYESVDTKRILNVQDFREDSEDDEDSGVTSDIGRMIPEIEVDSERAVSKNQKKYQRTQTHSRLFRLLNDDPVAVDCAKVDPSLRKEYLNLPLKTSTFSYDDSSDYSSGLASPEQSLIHEQSWRKFHDNAITNGSVASLPDATLHHSTNSQQQPEQVYSKDDPYFWNWKSAKLSKDTSSKSNVVPSSAFKVLNNKIPFWTYKVNVLCPRIKSSNSVPGALTAQHKQSFGKK
ncbi:LOW QUALITY PROTEIN: uncharacterized protein LOC105426031 [Pogonomyrmex barbatus]|uniref:LOW QUALITY PROTEIN: uncharacterized protein LOC105426031 n=1 Tax=Pogonomyrmex barbatus TaxID=144034 RepID=A0A6I9WTZ0_9HYME|nr:LOW QUALITY PROTEIN: uncharacterized protein LOC105426031 [Pogonomyrmex barbatus]